MTFESTIIKILEIVNKPFHFLFVGVVVLLLASAEYKIYGWIFLALAFASFIEWLIKLIRNKYRQKENEKMKKFEKLNQNQLIINKYNKLNSKEKEVIDTCINTNNLSFYKEGFYETLRTLDLKGFGKSLNSTFTMHENIFDILMEYKKVEETNA